MRYCKYIYTPLIGFRFRHRLSAATGNVICLSSTHHRHRHHHHLQLLLIFILILSVFILVSSHFRGYLGIGFQLRFAFDFLFVSDSLPLLVYDSQVCAPVQGPMLDCLYHRPHELLISSGIKPTAQNIY